MKYGKLLGIGMLLSFSSLAFAAPPSYNGVSEPGFVSVNADATYMEGRINVRLNPAAGHQNSYLYTHHYANNVVWFQGLDGSSGRFFACVIYTTSPLYAQAVDISNNLQDGARLLVWRDANSSECTRIGLSNGSRYTH